MKYFQRNPSIVLFSRQFHEGGGKIGTSRSRITFVHFIEMHMLYDIKIILDQFRKEDVNVLIFTPVGGRGLNLEEADVVIHLDVTSNLDDMTQRRERARGCIEYVLVLKGTSEEAKVKEYAKLTKASTLA